MQASMFANWLVLSKHIFNNTEEDREDVPSKPLDCF